MTTPRKKHSRLWVYLLYLGLVTSLILSVTLAKYASTATGTGTATVAAMAGDSKPIPIELVLDDLFPGGHKELQFKVVNYSVVPAEGAGTKTVVSEVAMDYTITVQTTGNLPLTFKLEKAAAETSVTGTTVADGEIPPDKLGTALTGGYFPLVMDENSQLVRQEHVYKLTATWPAEQSDIDYADEIDLVTVTVEASQRLAVPGA